MRTRTKIMPGKAAGRTVRTAARAGKEPIARVAVISGIGTGTRPAARGTSANAAVRTASGGSTRKAARPAARAAARRTYRPAAGNAGRKRRPSAARSAGRKFTRRPAPGARRLRGSGRALPAGKSPAFYAMGRRDAAEMLKNGTPPADPASWKLAMNRGWTQHAGRLRMSAASGAALQAGRAYANGYAEALHIPSPGWLPVAVGKTASAVVTCSSDLDPGALREMMRLPLQDVFVVLEETSGTAAFQAARSVPGVTVVHAAQPLGPNEGRAVGARLTQTDIVLFADGGARFAAEELAPFLAAVNGGADIALADRTASLGTFNSWDNVSRVKAFVNLSLGRPELQANSASALPCAWSGKAMAAVGRDSMSVPAMAHQSALALRLKLARCPVRYIRTGRQSTAAAAAREIGDHIAALRAAMAIQGGRLALRDKVRRRIAAGGGGQ
ncbi:hypothetical protein [Paenibacillus humicola]|uniref:hypothetical protein n=1 Tax=Paenibacillus humicola TaxID=3110540 RepID=UPI00237ABDD0|nr:hypothetical protein [Paenibacillus humicola]